MPSAHSRSWKNTDKLTRTFIKSGESPLITARFASCVLSHPGAVYIQPMQNGKVCFAHISHGIKYKTSAMKFQRISLQIFIGKSNDAF